MCIPHVHCTSCLVEPIHPRNARSRRLELRQQAARTSRIDMETSPKYGAPHNRSWPRPLRKESSADGSSRAEDPGRQHLHEYCTLNGHWILQAVCCSRVSKKYKIQRGEKNVNPVCKLAASLTDRVGLPRFRVRKAKPRVGNSNSIPNSIPNSTPSLTDP